MMEAGTVQPGGRAHRPRPPVRGWIGLVAVLVALVPFGAPAGAGPESGQSGSDRFVYEVPEPDPDHDSVARATARFAYSYPDRKANTEAAFTYDNKLVLVTKEFPGRVYRFDKPLSPSGVNVPTFVGELSDARGVSVTKPSPDRHWLVAATHDTLLV